MSRHVRVVLDVVSNCLPPGWGLAVSRTRPLQEGALPPAARWVRGNAESLVAGDVGKRAAHAAVLRTPSYLSSP